MQTLLKKRINTHEVYWLCMAEQMVPVPPYKKRFNCIPVCLFNTNEQKKTMEYITMEEHMMA